VTSSYDVSYRANSYGARDRERTRENQGKKRAIVLGDSFTEGYGVKSEDRFSDRLEAATGIEHLNFGTAGSFGPTQYYLLYKKLAKQFEHDAILVCLLPFNDFLDDDYEYGKIVHASRYRPYFVGKAPNFELIYSQKEVPPPDSKTIENLVREFTFTGNWLKRMKWLARHNASGLRPDYAGYLDYTPEQWQRLCHVLTLLRQDSKGKEMLVLTFPDVVSIQRMDGQTASALSTNLADFCRSQDMRYLDLLPGIRSAGKGWQACYYADDPHWNAYGHQVAAQCILTNWAWCRESATSSRTP
jgi:lysophospholipase L1-like esterase